MFVKIGMSYWLNAIHFYNDDSSNVLNIWTTSYKWFLFSLIGKIGIVENDRDVTKFFNR